MYFLNWRILFLKRIKEPLVDNWLVQRTKMKISDYPTVPVQSSHGAILKDIEHSQPRSERDQKRFMASVSIFLNSSSQKKEVLNALSKLDNINEVYEVKGEFDIVSIVSASSMEEFSYILRKKIMKIKGVKSTITSIFLKTYKQSKIA